MKKIIVSIILLVAAAIPAVPYFIGITIENTFRMEHEEMAAEAALSGFDVELVDYQRRVFNATATTRINMAAPNDTNSVSFELVHHIDHTPRPASQVIATVETGLLLSGETKEALAPLFKGMAPLTISTLVFLDGHQESTISSPAASGEVTGKETVAIEWKGMQGSAWQSAGRDMASLNVDILGLTAKAAHEPPQALGDIDSPVMVASAVVDAGRTTARQKLKSLSVGELKYNADMHRGESGLWHGKATGSITAVELEAIAPAGEDFTMHVDAIDMHGNQDEMNGLIKASGVIKTKLISINGFDLSNASYDVAIENLDAKALRAWQVALSRMAKKDPHTSDPLAPLIEQLPAMANAKPVIKVNDISVDSPMGRFAIRMNSQFIGEWSDMLLENPAMLATMIKADLDASVPRSVVISALQDNMRNALLARNAATDTEMSEAALDSAVYLNVSQQLSGWIGQGYIKENEAQLEAQVAYDAGKLTINGMDASPLMGVAIQ